MEAFGQERSITAAVAPVPSQEPLPAWDRRVWLIAIPLAFFVFYAFIPSLDNGFMISWDDDQNFLDNPHYRGLGAAQLKWAWSTMWVGVYQPLEWMLFGAQYVVCRLDPRGYHLISVLFHVANAVALYVLTVAMLVRCRAESFLQSPWTCASSAGLATALFTVHPQRVEAVAWASCQPYLPCALFSMLSILAYLRAFPTESSPRWGWRVGSFFLFVAALLFHPVPVSLPAVLLILDVYPLRRLGYGTARWFGASARGVLLEKVPFVLTSLVFMGLAIAAKSDAKSPVGHGAAVEGIVRASYAIWFYIEKTVVPLDIIAYYAVPTELKWLTPLCGLIILATLAALAGSLLLRHRWPGVLAAWLSYLVILAPNSGLVQISDQIAADRYSYMSMLGLVVLAAAGFRWLWEMSSRWRPGASGLIVLSLGALVALTGLTRNQCRTWLNAETLWTHALTHGGDDSWVVHNNLAACFQSQGKYEAAAAQYSEALRLYPDFAPAHNSLGTVLSRLGRYVDAVAHFALAVRLDPGFTNAHYNLGVALYRAGNYEAAKAQFADAIRLRPGFAEAYNASATIMACCPDARCRDGKQAVEFATRACELTKWKNPLDLHTLAAAQAEAGDFDAAVASQTRTLALVRGEPEKHDCRSRLALYQAKRPYREVSPRRAPTNARP